MKCKICKSIYHEKLRIRCPNCGTSNHQIFKLTFSTSNGHKVGVAQGVRQQFVK